MHIDTIVWPSEAYLEAIYDLARGLGLRHADDESIRFVIDDDTNRLARVEIDMSLAGVADRVRGHRVLGALNPEDSWDVSVMAVPTFDGEPTFAYGWLRTGLVRSFSGVRCYRLEVVPPEQEPADVISLNDALTVELAQAAELALPTGVNLKYPLPEEVAGKHVFGRLAWDLAAKAGRVTAVPRAVPDLFRQANAMTDRPERVAEFMRMAMRRLAFTYRVRELSPAELRQL